MRRSADAKDMTSRTKNVLAQTAPRLLLAATVLLAFAVMHVSGLLNLGSWADDFLGKWGYNVMYTCVGLCVICGGLSQDARRAGWLIIGSSILIWTVGNIYYTAVLWDAEVIPSPSFSDLCWFLFYPGCLAGLIFIFRGETRHEGHGLRLDGVVAGLTVAAFVTTLVINPILAATDGTVSVLVTASPFGDMILLAFLIGAAASVGWSGARGVVLLALGFTSLAFLDFIYQLKIATGTWVPGTLLEAAWVPAFILVGLGAWQYKPVAHRQLHQRNPVALVAVPVVFALADVALLVYDHYNPIDPLALLLATAAIVTVIARMGFTFVHNLMMLRGSEIQAVTDSLTGIGNRRKLRDDLDALIASNDEGFLVMFDLDGFKGYNDTFGHPAGDALLERLGQSLAQAATGRATAYRMGGDEFCLLGRTKDASAELTASLGRVALSESGDGFNVAPSLGWVQIPPGRADAETILREADLQMYAEKNCQRESAARQTSNALLMLLGERSPELREHIGGVEELASAVASDLGMSPLEVEEVRLAAQLHDVGKAAIPDRILNKPGPLTEEEWQFMRQHTIIGERIISAAPSLRGVAKLVRASHEAYDGKGYPDALAGDAIPLGAKIVAVCDAYDAMTSDRPYRSAISTQEAVAELRRCSGTQFDPEVVDAIGTVLLDRALEALLMPQH